MGVERIEEKTWNNSYTNYEIYGENSNCKQTVKVGDFEIKELKMKNVIKNIILKNIIFIIISTGSLFIFSI